MKEHIEELLLQSLMHLERNGVLPRVPEDAVQLERTRSPEHGEFATNLALTQSKVAGKPPRELAQEIIDNLPPSRHVDKTEIAGPGFINFFLNPGALTGVIKEVLREREDFGQLTPPRRERATVEFVSANPTGPLHVGHGRGAAYGASLANILARAGHEVQREYYVNDNGRQMD
ncbi:MAG: arginine--tRNA ligase, partial [Xanthomonadales bacterium]|nr:arginine--tRNA ligase [Xanthomonadales bacterium]